MAGVQFLSARISNVHGLFAVTVESLEPSTPQDQLSSCPLVNSNVESYQYVGFSSSNDLCNHDEDLFRCQDRIGSLIRALLPIPP